MASQMRVRDFNRQSGLLDPSEFRDISISIIGAGATGSHVASILAQMGIGYMGSGTIKVFDFDTVEAHNIGNQAFHPKHVGMSKVEALKELLKERFDVNIEAHNMKVTNQPIVQSNYVFLLTDTMESRKEIYESALKYSFNTDMVIETRMGLTDGRVYAFNPTLQGSEWAKTLYSDSEAEVSLCGTSASIAVSAHLLSALAVSRLVHHYRNERSELISNKAAEKSPWWNEMILSICPDTYMCRTFNGEYKVLI